MTGKYEMKKEKDKEQLINAAPMTYREATEADDEQRV
jgi:hypothetical protein